MIILYWSKWPYAEKKASGTRTTTADYTRNGTATIRFLRRGKTDLPSRSMRGESIRGSRCKTYEGTSWNPLELQSIAHRRDEKPRPLRYYRCNVVSARARASEKCRRGRGAGRAGCSGFVRAYCCCYYCSEARDHVLETCAAAAAAAVPPTRGIVEREAGGEGKPTARRGPYNIRDEGLPRSASDGARWCSVF